MVSIKSRLIFSTFALTASCTTKVYAHFRHHAQAVDPSSVANAQVGSNSAVNAPQVGAAIGANLASKAIPGVTNNAQNNPQNVAMGAQLFGDIGAGVGGGIGVAVGSELANKVVGSPDDPNAGFIKKQVASFGQNIASSVGAGVGAGIGGGVGEGIANRLIPGGSTEMANANAQVNAKDMTARGANAAMVNAGTNTGLVSRLGVKIGSGIGGFANKKIVSAIGVAAPSAPATQAMPQSLPQGLPQVMLLGVAPGTVAGEADFSSLTGGRGDVVAGVVPGTQVIGQGK